MRPTIRPMVLQGLETVGTEQAGPLHPHHPPPMSATGGVGLMERRELHRTSLRPVGAPRTTPGRVKEARADSGEVPPAVVTVNVAS